MNTPETKKYLLVMTFAFYGLGLKQDPQETDADHILTLTDEQAEKLEKYLERLELRGVVESWRLSELNAAESSLKNVVTSLAAEHQHWLEDDRLEDNDMLCRLENQDEGAEETELTFETEAAFQKELVEFAASV